MELLTLTKLKEIAPQTILGTGVVNDPRLYKEPVRWVAIRGNWHDWAIYYHLEEHPTEWILRHGDKVKTFSVIRELIPCDETAIQMYRL